MGGLDFSKDRLFSVGDLIDREVQHREVVKLLSEPWFFSLRMLETLYKK